MDTRELVMARLAQVRDPELGASIVELGMVGEVHLVGGVVHVEVALTTAACPLRGPIERDVRESLLGLEGVSDVRVELGVMDAAAKAAVMEAARAIAQSRAPETSIGRGVPVFMIASGKGGVGKSSIAPNVAVALAKEGRHVGVLDADIWGFSLARLLDLGGEVAVRGRKILPQRRDIGGGSVSLLSMGQLADERSALLWRGLIVQKAVAQFIEDADWSEVDVMVIDTPPGTGDIVMTLARLLPHMGQVVVTTPSRAAQDVAGRAADFARRSHIRLLGVIENMSSFECECGRRHSPLGSGGGEQLARDLGTELLARVPLRDDLVDGGDQGRPVALADDGEVFAQLARRLIDLSPQLVPAGCTARMLDAIDAALRQSDVGS